VNEISSLAGTVETPDTLSRPSAMGARKSDKVWDAIVIGAGHNGLINAAYLQRAGLDVLVVEKNAHIGGAAVSSVLHDGWTYSNCSYVCSLLRPEIQRDLELYKHGLQVIPYEGGMTMMRNGDRFCSYYDHDIFRAEIARFSKKDADAYDHYATAVMKMCRWIKPLLMRTPPDPTRFRPRDIAELIHLARHFSGLGERDMGELIRFFTLSIAEFLDEYFETDVVKAHFAGSGIIGTALGPYSPGTAYVLLHHYMGDIDGSVGAWGFARGGMGSVSKACAGAFQAAGGTIETNAEVGRVLIRNGRAEGVMLADGTVLRAKRVVSNLDVKRTFTKIVQERELPADFLDTVKKFKIRGSSGKLNIALDGMPDFTNVRRGHPSLRGDLHFTDGMERMERAYDDWKAGRWSRDPYVDMLIPTQIDPTMAPAGKHYMSVFVQYAPPVLADGRSWDGPARDEFRETVLSQIAEQSPNFRDLIRHVETRSPWDIENEVGLTEGNIFQGELTMDQLIFNRPVPGYAQYRAPIAGMYMCGSSTHPGGGVMGAPGANAAREILRDLRIKGFDPREEHDL
jgi:phytoene dehydrogenase-like protein